MPVCNLSRPIVSLLVWVLASSSAAAPRYFAHEVREDAHGVIAPWYTGLNGQCDLRVRIAAETLKRYPWTRGKDGKPLPDYIYNGRWSIATDGTITPGELKDWGNGDLVQRGSYAIFGLVAYYRYSGDPAAIAHVRLIADAMLDRCRTGPDHDWPDFIISVPNAGEPYGPCSDKGMIQLDLAALAGSALLQAYQLTGNDRYVEAPRHWGQLLATKRSHVPGQSPWNRYANPQDVYWNDRQTGGAVLIVRLLDELIRVQGDSDPELVAARDAGRAYIQNMLLPRWYVDETWGRDYWDWEHPVQSESLSEFVPRYFMQYPDAFPNWANDCRNILGLYHTRACVSPLSNGDVYHGAWAYPEGSQCCERSLSYAPMQIGAALAEYGVRANDAWALELAHRQLILATYDAHETGVVEDNMDGGQVVAGGWFQISHPLPLAYVLDAMGWLPDVLGPNRENHLMRSSSIIREIDYAPGRVSYTAFDAPAGSVDLLRLAFTPNRIRTERGDLKPSDPQREIGYHLRPLANGDCIVTIRRDGCRQVIVEGNDPARRIDVDQLATAESWAALASGHAGASAELEFEGNQVRFIGSVGPDGGLADVYLDGVRQLCGIDSWNPEQRRGVLWYRSGLPAGKHTLRIVAEGKGNPLSQGSRVNIEAIDVSSADGKVDSGEGGGPADAQRWIFGYTGRSDYIDSQGHAWRPATEIVIRLGHVADAVSAWYVEPRRLTVAGTNDPTLYAHGIHGQDFTAYATVAPGTYHVRLKFMEHRWEIEPAARAVDIFINGRQVVDDMDIAATAAGAPAVVRLVPPSGTKLYDGLNRAVDLVFNDVRPVHGVIAIRFRGNHGGEAIVSALEIGPGAGGQGATPVPATASQPAQ